MKKIPKNVLKSINVIKEFCIKQLNKADDDTEYCKDCPFYIEGKIYERECFFGVETPDNWEVEEL
jgi:hypothetical protein